MSDPFLAEIRMLPYTYPPRDWAYCDGQIIPIAQNPALFAIINTIYGGDGRSTMGLPNLQIKTPMHPGRGPGLTSHQLGDVGGSNYVPLTQDQMPVHNHKLRGTTEATTAVTDPTNQILAKAKGRYAPDDGSATVSMAPETLTNTGSDTGHSNMQPSVAVNFCICLDGLFPSRS